MSDNRKYYYLKLKENYFDDDSIVLLESMQDGVLYSNILLKLYLKSLKHGGRLQLDENIPYTAQMIATITRQQIGTVERALQIFLKLGLVEVLDSGTFYMSNIELLIGQSSTEAERKRAARLQNKALSAPRTNGGHLSDIRPPEIEIELKVGRPLSNTTYITTPQTTIILPMDRSIPPEISRMLIAIVRIPSTQICWKIATMLLMPIKLGLIHEIITTINAITIARRTR